MLEVLPPCETQEDDSRLVSNLPRMTAVVSNRGEGANVFQKMKTADVSAAMQLPHAATLSD